MAATLSLLVMVAVTVSWVQSYAKRQAMSYGWGTRLTVMKGAWASAKDGRITAGTGAWQERRSGFDTMLFNPPPGLAWQDSVLPRFNPSGTSVMGKLQFGWRRTIGGPRDDMINRYDVSLPHWSLVAVASLFPTIWLVAWRRQCRRVSDLRQGRCTNCGYDLRGTPGRCPECGAVAVAGDVVSPSNMHGREG